MTKLCPRGKAAAKRKFKVYPSAYANAYASKICAGKIKDPSGVKRKDFKGPKPAGAKKGAMMIIIGVGKKKKVDKKMGGGMMKRYNTGGDANTMIKKSGIKDPKVMMTAHSMKDKDRLTQRDIEKAKELVKSQSPRQKASNVSKRIMAAIKGAKDFRSAYNRDAAKVQKRMGGGLAAATEKLKAKGLNKGGDAKIKKVITGLNKASALHKGQAKSLQSIVKKSKGGGADMGKHSLSRRDVRMLGKKGTGKLMERREKLSKKMGGGMMNKGGGADYMNTVKARKRGNPGITGPTPKSLKEKNKLSGGGMARGSGAAIRGNKFQGIF